MVPSISSSDSDRTTRAIPSEDVLYRVLSVQRRRDALSHLNEAEGENGIELADLAREVALGETGPDGDSVSAAEIRPVHVSLYHVHVPNLAAVNAVEFDPTERTVDLTDTGRAIVAELERLADRGE